MGKFGETEEAKATVIGQAKNIGNILGIHDRKWRFEFYGPLGWIEDILKGLAMIVAFASITQYEDDSFMYLPYSSWTIVIMVLMGILLAIQCVLFIQRLFEKEVHAIIFSIISVAAHSVLFTILFLSVDPGTFVFTFCFLWMMGEFVKLMFLFVVSDFQVLWFKKPILYAISLVIIVLQILIVIFQVIFWSTEYED